MKTFDKKTKQKYIDRAVAHRKADEIIQGHYWKGGKGCCVGCLSHDNEYAHKALSEQIGVPEWLPHLADKIHEGLPEDESKYWPEQFIAAIPENRSEKWFEKTVKPKFLTMVLKSALTHFDHEKYTDVKICIDNVIALYESGLARIEDFQRAAEAAAEAEEAAAGKGEFKTFRDELIKILKEES